MLLNFKWSQNLKAWLFLAVPPYADPQVHQGSETGPEASCEDRFERMKLMRTEALSPAGQYGGLNRFKLLVSFGSKHVYTWTITEKIA